MLKNRIKSLLWRAGSVALVAGLSTIIDGLPELGLNETLVVLIALVLSEVTKLLNSSKKSLDN